MPASGPLNRQLRISALLVISGLLTEGLCLLWARPIAFVVLVSLGGGLIASGVFFSCTCCYSLQPGMRDQPAGKVNDLRSMFSPAMRAEKKLQLPVEFLRSTPQR